MLILFAANSKFLLALTKPSYEIKLRKMTSDFELLTRNFL